MNRDRLKRFVAVAGALAWVSWLGGAPAASADVLRVGVAAAGGGDPVTFGGSSLSIVRNQQLLEKAFAGSGTEVQWFFFKGAGPAVNEALSNQQIDFAYEGDLPQVVARANGLDTRLLAAIGTRAPVYVAVPKGSDIHTLAQLKGKKVAIFRGTNGHLLAIKVLATAGLTERDLKVINLDTGSSQAALVSNGVDAAFGGYELFKLRDEGLVDLIYANEAQDPALTRQTALLVRTAYAQEHPQQVQQVVDTLVDAARWSSDPANQQAVYEEFAKSGTPVSSWQAEFAPVPLKERLSPLVDSYVIGRYQAVADQALQEKLIRRPVKVDGWFDTHYLDAALKAKGLQGFWTAYGADGKQAEHNAATASAPAGKEHDHEPG
ncbi:ABC transporter substrate-binding protein [Pseudomonas typographi]|uniref:ABC transporter substrate-binding protein n=1 Tax=Pseudomonas typographi TaxID=2715964 RepID=UPI001681CD62|nr:ABC transporter substrate-binding protein [Pseudomonas typographi]MBD1550765.1 ABC transporter substrate-binding protein [Pseudomonas typographi]MBD1587707.1 ABC transporter substrate-binding protein [Pseudomonas typographi]